MIAFQNCDMSRRWLHNGLLSTGLCLFYKMIAIDLSKQEALDTDPKKIQLILLDI